MASPFVAGEAALIFSQNPSWTNTQVENRIMETADDLGVSGRDDYYGYGRINVVGALDNISPTIGLTSPVGGERWAGGSSHNITWNASDIGVGISTTGVSLYYSTDGGQTFPNVIVSGIPNSGSYSWTVPKIDSNSAKIKVVVSDLVGNSSFKVSDSNFAIDSTSPAISLIIPKGGERWAGGSTENITWNALDTGAGISNNGVSLYYSTDAGETFPNVIVRDIPNSGSYSWTVPKINSNSVRVKIAVADEIGNLFSQAGIGDFTIDSNLSAGTAKVVGAQSSRGTINPDNGDTARIYFNSNEIGNFTCKIFTVDGELVFENSKDGDNTGMFEWVPQDMSSGIYIVSVKGPGVDFKGKLAILR